MIITIAVGLLGTLVGAALMYQYAVSRLVAN